MNNASRHRRIHSIFRPRLECLESRLTPTAYTVSSLADSGDNSLRAAITSVNADTTADEIDFSVAGVVKLTSGALPAITNTVNINGRSAPDFAGTPLVEIDNNGFAGLVLSGSNSTLASLSIVNANGAGVTLGGSYGNPFGGGGFGQTISVVGNYIGLALDGSIAANTGYGLQITNSTSTIGGLSAADRNVISGNGAGGIQIEDQATGIHISLPNGAVIEGNFIGTDPTGQSAAPNQGNGVTIVNAGSTIGGTEDGAGNVIAFNTQAGVMMSIDNGVLGNSIFSNGSIGIDVGGQSSASSLPAPRLSYAVESPTPNPATVHVEVGGVVNIGSAIASESNSGIVCTVQVFATLNGVPPGQGQIFVGSVQVTADSNGFAKFTLKNGSIPAGSGTTFTATVTIPFIFSTNTSEFSAAIPVGGNINNLYVASAYELLLHRFPDTGAAYWVNLMNNGGSAAGVVLGIESSPEYLSAQVSAMYQFYLRRPADPAGAQGWTNFLLAGGTLEQVGEAMVSSQEFYVLQGGTNQGFITGLYDFVLRRSPSTGEVAGWETALDAGVSRASVAIAFFTSPEYRTDLVQADYMTFLQRAADDGGVAAWVNALNAGATDQQVLAQIFGSAEGYQLWS